MHCKNDLDTTFRKWTEMNTTGLTFPEGKKTCLQGSNKTGLGKHYIYFLFFLFSLVKLIFKYVLVIDQYCILLYWYLILN